MISNGIDIIKIDRFETLKNNSKFMNSIFREEELKYIKESNYSNATIAGLYACKEAFLKAIKKGINNYNIKDIEISHGINKDPFIILHNSLKDKYKNISVSISHDGEYAISIVSFIN